MLLLYQMGLLRAILDLVFPVYCVGCKIRGSYLCPNCLMLCPAAERESAKWIFPIYDYRYPPIKKAVWILKYNRKHVVADIFAEILYGPILEELADLKIMENFNAPLLLPIPLSPSRVRERGYNQAELICRKLLALDQGRNFSLEKNALVKIKNVEHQARIENRKQRLENIVGSFGIKNALKIKNRNIILIDDVTTTGATLSEARKTLKNAGARKVIAFTVAH